MRQSNALGNANVQISNPPAKATASGFWRIVAVSAVVFGIALVAMAIGVILSNRRIKGSCGGMASLTDQQGRPLCEGCTNPAVQCAAELEKERDETHAPRADQNSSG